MKHIQNERFGEERALYALTDAVVENCRFAGEEDGESALKESREIEVEHCEFELRYPLWHHSQVLPFPKCIRRRLVLCGHHGKLETLNCIKSWCK